jgi:hypothetical protein
VEITNTMANEAILIQQLQDRLPEVTMADGASGTDIEKGTILQLTDANTGSASSADGQFFAGILASENVGADGQTRYAVWTKGIFDLKLTDATVAAGEPVKIAGANLVALADDDTIENSREVVGVALQDGAANEVIEVMVGER